MIKEFALEPDVLASSFREFCYFVEKFGISQGRVISRFPRNWKRLVYAAAQKSLNGTAELSRIEIRLDQLPEDALVAFGRPGGDVTQPWLSRAVVEHARQPFAAIIATSNPLSHADILLSHELDESDARFNSLGQTHINRTAAEIVSCVHPLLCNSRKVKLIDPHFDPTAMRWKRMLGLALNAMGTNAQAGTTLEIHRSDRIPTQHITYCFNTIIPQLRPASIRVLVYVHPDAGMHNRFILTDIGGASFNTGLDDNEDGGSTPQDLVTLLTADVFANELNRYSGGAPLLAFG